MKALVSVLVLVLTTVVSVSAQSGRRKPPISSPTPTPEATPATPKPVEPKAPQVTAEKNQDYRCTVDGTLAHLIDDPTTVKGYLPKEVDTRAEILERPDPRYTEEARRAGVQGTVLLKLLLSPTGTIERVRIVRRLPYGLTENAIRAACGVKFKPAVKGGEKVPQWVAIEYGFLLSRSSIYGP
jgi:protein TonB